MPFFIKKPIIIEAVLWTGDNVRDIAYILNGDSTNLKGKYGDVWQVEQPYGNSVILYKNMYLIIEKSGYFKVLNAHELDTMYKQTPKNPKEEDKPNRKE